MRIGAQGFEGSPLDRTVLSSGDAIPDDMAEHVSSRFLALANGKPLMQGAPETSSLLWLQPHTIQQMIKQRHQQDVIAELYLLGRHPEGGHCFAANLRASEDELLAAVKDTHAGAWLSDLRSLMRVARADDMAVAGHAAALVNWHNVRPANRNCAVFLGFPDKPLSTACYHQHAGALAMVHQPCAKRTCSEPLHSNLIC